MTPREFLRRLALGTNVAREAVLGLTAPELATLAADGFTHVRNFIPATADGRMGVRLGDEGAIRRYLDAWATLAAAGLPVLAAAHDLCDVDAAAAPETEAHIRLVARMVAAHPGLGPDRLALAALNEAEGGTAAEWHPHLARLTAALRDALPQHVLLVGGHDWSALESVCDAPPPADEGTAYDVHQYWQPWSVTWADWRDRLLRLRVDTRREVVLGELGPGHQGERASWPDGPLLHTETAVAAWPERYAAAQPVITALPCTLWAHEAPGKAWFRLNAPEGFALRPELADTVRGLTRAAAEANAWIVGRLDGRLDGLREGIEKGQRVGETLGRAVGRRLGWDAAVAAVQADVGSRYAYRETADG